MCTLPIGTIDASVMHVLGKVMMQSVPAAGNIAAAPWQHVALKPRSRAQPPSAPHVSHVHPCLACSSRTQSGLAVSSHCPQLADLPIVSTESRSLTAALSILPASVQQVPLCGLSCDFARQWSSPGDTACGLCCQGAAWSAAVYHQQRSICGDEHQLCTFAAVYDEQRLLHAGWLQLCAFALVGQYLLAAAQVCCMLTGMLAATAGWHCQIAAVQAGYAHVQGGLLDGCAHPAVVACGDAAASGCADLPQDAHQSLETAPKTV